jgi:hypothetical protein
VCLRVGQLLCRLVLRFVFLSAGSLKVSIVSSRLIVAAVTCYAARPADSVAPGLAADLFSALP